MFAWLLVLLAMLFETAPAGEGGDESEGGEGADEGGDGDEIKDPEKQKLAQEAAKWRHRFRDAE